MTQRINSIQYLRGAAALAVVVYHAVEKSGARFGIGAAGVDVFFVISGFIMWTVTRTQPVGAGAFMLHRLLRIVPLYWIVTVALAGIALLVPAAFPTLRPTLWHVVASLLFIPHRDSLGHAWPLIVAGWTLCYEMFFYVAFAMVLLFPRRQQIRLISVFLGLCFVVGQILAPDQPVLNTYTNPLLLEFLIGIWIAALWRAGRICRPGAGVACIALSLVSYAALESLHFYVDAWRLVLWGIPAALLVYGMLACETTRIMARLRPLAILGDASYAIYLVHGLVISAVGKLLSGVAAPAMIPLCVLFAVAAGLAVHVLVERPMTRLLRRGIRFNTRLRPA